MGNNKRRSTRTAPQAAPRKRDAPSRRLHAAPSTSPGSGRKRGRPPTPSGGALSSRAAAKRVERQLAGQAAAAKRSGVHAAGALKRGVMDAARLVAALPGAPPPAGAPCGDAALVVVVLLRETLWPTWEVWGAWEALHAGAVAVYCHLEAGVEVPDTPEGQAIRERLLLTRKASLQDELSLTETMLYAATEAIAKQPQAAHAAFASGVCIPVARASSSTLPPAGASFFQPLRLGAPALKLARSALRAALEEAGESPEAAAAWGEGLQLYHQWCILAVPLVLTLLSHREEIKDAGRAMARALPGHPAVALVPDKALLLLTAAHRYSLTHRGLLLTQRASTLVHYDAGSSGDGTARHPVTWRSLPAADAAEVVIVRSGGRGRAAQKRLSFPEALADAALPANRSLFMRKVQLDAADVPELLAKLRAGPWPA